MKGHVLLDQAGKILCYTPYLSLVVTVPKKGLMAKTSIESSFEEDMKEIAKLTKEGIIKKQYRRF